MQPGDAFVQHVERVDGAARAVESRHNPRDTRSMKLYHATSRAIAERIKAEGFVGHEVFYGEHPATGAQRRESREAPAAQRGVTGPGADSEKDVPTPRVGRRSPPRALSRASGNAQLAAAAVVDDSEWQEF